MLLLTLRFEGFQYLRRARAKKINQESVGDAVITTGLLGAFWAVVYLKRRSSVAPIVSHAGFNSLEILRIVVGGL